ncbi:MAG: ATP synthase F1 subunit delta [Smithella sp.]|nr:ATP synthase F1 subunit delta [Syntrophaceae bacterium]NMC90743.1 ATP synthase F1 subunit delta [Smithella sp.]HNV57145.1 ATP synthase F1 subunit delta [Smithellaceae bacterium]MBP9532034.1 ATP synthase F1 subunit delta [Syntrophaceae bacterium]MBP9650492.1 ATP synthase F1 subunit delta [Syntrophaceae bacterium]
MISNISKRYARAFFDIAGEEQKLEQYYNELHQFSSVIAQNKDLGGFLANPIFEQEIKKKVLEKIIGKLSLSPMTINFLKLLIDKKRIDILPDIETCYRQLMDETLQKVRVTVKTAFPLSGEMQSYITSSLKKMTGRTVDVTVENDKNLLGGIVIGVGDTLYDGSIKNQLNNMRNLLGEAR